MTTCQITWNGRLGWWEWLDPVTGNVCFDKKKYQLERRATECLREYVKHNGALKFLLKIFTREGALQRTRLIKPGRSHG